MAYAIIRTAKYKSNVAIAGLMRHHLREEPSKIKGLDPSRSHLNLTIGAQDSKGLFKAIADRIATVTYTHPRAHETSLQLGCRLMLSKRN